MYAGTATTSILFVYFIAFISMAKSTKDGMLSIHGYQKMLNNPNPLLSKAKWCR
jgi:hypothetical protein